MVPPPNATMARGGGGLGGEGTPKPAIQLAPAAAPSAATSEPSPMAFTAEKQREIQDDLERQFAMGLRRRDGRTVGLGL